MDNTFLIKLGMDTQAIAQGIAKSNKLVEGFGRSINQTLKGAFTVTAAVQGFKHVVGVIADFEKRMSEVRAITGANGKAFEDLRNNALNLGRTTLYTAEQVGELQVAYGRLGFSNDEILKVTKSTLDLATATGEDLAKSADIAGSTLRAFNLDASKMQNVIDVMAASFNKSALGLENFGEAMKYVAPVAASANISLEETTAMLGVLADAGIRGSMAGTSLRKIISDVKGETGSLTERLQKLADKGLTGAQAMDEVGRTAYASLLILTKHVDKVNEATEAYKNVAGEVKKMSDIMSDNLAGDWTKFNTSIDGFILSGGESAGVLRGLVQNATKLTTALSSAEGALGKFIGGWLKFIGLVPIATADMAGAMADIFGPVREDNVTEAMNTLKRLRDEAKFKGDQEGVMTYTKLMIELVNKYKLIKDVAVETVVETEKQNNALSKQADILNRIRAAVKFERPKVTPPPMEMKDSFEEDPAPEVEIPEDMFDTTDKLFGFADKWTQAGELFVDTNTKVKESFMDLGSSISGALVTVAEGLGQAIAGVGNFGDTIVKALAGFARQIGETLIGIGIGMLAAKMAIKNPYTAIAAGIALVALSGALSAGLSSAQGGFNGGGDSGGSSMGNRSITEVSGRALNPIERIQLGGVIEIAGDKLLVVLRNAEQKDRVRRG